MSSNLFTRRDFSISVGALIGLGVARPAFGVGASECTLPFAERITQLASSEISHSAEAIHQEVDFRAGRNRIYEALTETKQFDAVIQLSEAAMSRGKKATEISREVGGAFSLFGGYIIGRHVEMVTNERLVQAWREISWKPGLYSLVKFELLAQGTGTKLVFDHTGFPLGAAEHLVVGWKANYWDPLQKYLS